MPKPSIIDYFQTAVEKFPNNVAVVYDNQKITYKTFNEAVNKFCHYLINKGIQKGDIINIVLPRGIDALISIFAVIKCGAVYVPVDPAYPVERIKLITDDANARFVITSRNYSNLLQSVAVSIIIEDALKESAHFPVHNPEVKLQDEDLIYILYTSGSTGKPKGVMMPQLPLANLINWQNKNSESTAYFNTLQFSPLTFDVSFQELFATLTTGGTLFLIEDDLRLDAEALLHFITHKNINRIFLPFVALQMLCDVGVAKNIYPQSLKEVITAGEQLKVTPQVVAFFSQIPAAKLVNQYGPTECHVVTSLVLNGSPANWPELPAIGTAIDNVNIYILNEQLEEVAANEQGELCIGGLCVAKGYLNKADLTNDKFLNWLPKNKQPDRIYRTGDIARFLPNGDIEFLGRIDDQVKIRGYRIEPGEIENVILQMPDITNAVVVAKGHDASNKKLIAYLISNNGADNTVEVRKFLLAKLPDYMVPSAFVWMSAFPKTPSGKIDKKALPLPLLKRPELSNAYIAPSGKLQTAVANVWKYFLGYEEIGVTDNFFELGGNSLLAQKMIAKLKDDLDLKVPITKLYQYPTIKGLTNIFENVNKTQTVQNRGLKPAHSIQDVAIIGMECNFPGAENIEAYWQVLANGIETTTFWSTEEIDHAVPVKIKENPDYVKARGIIKDAELFDAAFFGIPPALASLMDPQQRLFLETSRNLLEKTGYLINAQQLSIGVFAGCNTNTYYNNNVISHQDKIEAQGKIPVAFVTDKDYIASRVSYQLNLNGPAVNVNSACSTSLLAVAQAIESIRSGQCDVAIAGAAALNVPVNSGHLYEEGSMLSNDGHCRPFDADAKGTVFSDGVGAVLLKSLAEAEKDGDVIYAVIKGVGVNNDGGEKASFTAPSALGQSGAIEMAIADAGVDAANISYIETHGTATPIGDPIEIEGLVKAFGSQPVKQYCKIGSVKSNMGHLVHAAGVAGLIKTVLALHKGKIPPTLFYKKANPLIDFENTPFAVNATLANWPTGIEKIAGVSSFGVGGTNVHVIVQEYKQQQAVARQAVTPGAELITWSAKINNSLIAYADVLKNYLQRVKDISLADVAYTLQTTRPAYAYRNYVVAHNTADLIQQLANVQNITATSQKAIAAEPVAFMFPGQGSQYVNMGRELYQKEKIYKEAIDECAQILIPFIGEDIREILFTGETFDDVAAAEKLKNTFYTQPAIFVTSYALAKLYMSYGINPAVLIGHSVGEFVAAHLAGILSLNDALKIISKRAALISELPGGVMLSVRTAAENIKSLLPNNISIAAINAPNLCVLSGKAAAIEAFSKTLSEKDIANKVLKTSHAFHSYMMDAVIEPLKKTIESVKLHVPQIPLVSTVTGMLLKDEEAVSPLYWAMHARETVNFSGGIQWAEEKFKPVFLEAGPGTTTAVLARQHNKQMVTRCFSALNTGNTATGEEASFKKSLGDLWKLGVNINLDELYTNSALHILHSVPTYSFNKKRYWLDPKPFTPVANGNTEILQPQLLPQEAFIDNTDNLTEVMERTQILSAKIKEIIESSTGYDVSDAPGNRNFTELGLDSLLLTQMATAFKKEFKVPVSFRQLNESCDTIDKLAMYLNENLPSHLFMPAAASRPVVKNNTTPVAVTNINVGGNNTGALQIIAQQLNLLTQQVAQLQGTAVTVHQEKQFTPIEESNTSNDITEQEKAALKKPFGAIAKIEVKSTEVNEAQKTFLNNFIERYNKKTKASKEYTQQHRSYMADPRVVSGFKPLTKELVYSLVVNKSKGCNVWDIDGNKYVDALNGFGSSFLGYQPDFLKKALIDQIEAGYEIGPQHELAGEVCHLICELTGSDRAGLCNTGSEAVLGAMRIARTVTGKNLIVAFSGSYHGIMDEVLVRGTKKLKTFPAASGILSDNVQNMLILDYGEESSLKIIEERIDEIAAVLVEPVQSRRPEFQPVEFIKALRRITLQHNTALILDEVITGFRSHPRGVQALFDVQADMATYGKIIGGGLSIGVIAGKKKFLDALDGGFWQYGDASIPQVGVTYFAGTFVRHPLALATAYATLMHLKKEGPSLQEALTLKTGLFANRLNQICRAKNIPVFVAHFASLWKIKFSQEYPYHELLFALMRHKNVHIWDGFPCFFTTAHTQADIDFIVKSFEESVDELLAVQFIPKNETNAVSDFLVLDNSNPPVAGARLGRDPQGNPTWYVLDENNQPMPFNYS